MADEYRAAALSTAAQLVRDEQQRRGRRREDDCELCVDQEKPHVDALGGVARELELMAAASSRDARERLARHLYLVEWGDYLDAGDRWDSGQVGDDIRNEFLTAADAALNAINGTEN
ncbi:hypothetical protein QQG74_09360 [Micromonospora sp. FIMYZ51]|uniref:hypothetical protein n=1 Tax=Micromonospora sp. FIMYZ51 TaxID=3051832 RepID=UPI00311EDA1E